MTEEEIENYFVESAGYGRDKVRNFMDIVNKALKQKGERIADLEKENAKLRKDKKELCHSISEGGKACVYLNDQLTKAKELLNEFMRISKASDEDFEHDYSELIGEAEQFVNSEVENV